MDEGHRTEPGHRREEDFLEICIQRFGFKRVSPEAIHTDKNPDGFAIVRTGESEDFERKVDFWIFRPPLPKKHLGPLWIPVDLTTNPNEVKAKESKERRTGIRSLFIDARVLISAQLGGEVFLGEVEDAIIDVVTRPPLR